MLGAGAGLVTFAHPQQITKGSDHDVHSPRKLSGFLRAFLHCWGGGLPLEVETSLKFSPLLLHSSEPQPLVSACPERVEPPLAGLSIPSCSPISLPAAPAPLLQPPAPLLQPLLQPHSLLQPLSSPALGQHMAIASQPWALARGFAHPHAELQGHRWGHRQPGAPTPVTDRITESCH